jgi:hypothetical protein
MTHAIHRRRSREVRPFLGLVLFCYWTILIAQMTQSVSVDIFSSTDSFRAFFGYVIALLLAVPVVIRGFRQQSVDLVLAVIVILFILYLSTVVYATDPGRSIPYLLLSQYGVALWYFLGVATGISSDHIASLGVTRHRPFVLLCGYVVLVVVSVRIAALVLRYWDSPSDSSSYQSAAAFSFILFGVLTVGVKALWQGNAQRLLTLFLFALYTALATVIARAQSTGIIVLWFGMLTSILVFERRRLWSVLTFVLFLLGAASTTALRSWLSAEIFEPTRLSQLFGDQARLSSVSSRLSVNSSFMGQFNVSPVFGDFRSEYISGFGAGFYAHSLPLSLLTHTGVVGFMLVLVCILKALVKYKPGNDVQAFELQAGLLLLLALLYSSFATFFTWPPFWFFLGFASRRLAPVKRIRGSELRWTTSDLMPLSITDTRSTDSEMMVGPLHATLDLTRGDRKPL